MYLQAQILISKIDRVLLVMEIETMFQPISKDLQKINIKQKILRKNMILFNKMESYIIMRMILNSIKELESIFIDKCRKIQNRLSARRVRGRKENAF